ncbi:methylamine utilization protein MauJ [Sulfuriflexus mobilis]|uniref:methylamine utilization protein MauJ n=1 Tax=Sulfuriflexus mobilis TaxID=1811807 RepID=UPI000F8422EF|nr:methylamine utilization protein MauJ [Sulfuriflexus mobilis]
MKYLAEYELHSHACLEDATHNVLLKHPEGIYEVELREKSVNPGDEYSLLTAYITFQADSIDEAKELSEKHIKEYVDILTFGTNINIKVGYLLKLADWTEGIEDRQCYIFNKFPGDDRPYPLISNELIDSLEFLLKANISPLLRRALKWFSNGVSAQYSDDQFQYFWFVLELLSQIYKKSEKVNDACPKCGQALFCESCNEHPKHKPYPKQAIKHLLSIMISDYTDDIFDTLNKIRNALMHGDDIKQIEESLELEFSKYVDKIGQIAWVSLFNTFANSFEEPVKKQLNLIQVNIYSHMTLTTNVVLVFKSKDPDGPKIEELPDLKVSAIYDNKE